ncbi:MAG: hypothetical protein M0R49_03030 [Limnochordia bacterium]|jgi:hypothetical protein|nr:hypothetical protein [Limnochordia bacterium]
MSLFVYEKALDYESSDKLLSEIRQTVRQLKRAHPKLQHCSLADVMMKRSKATVNVTLFFQP